MRIGLWGARSDNTGLGVQTWEFYRHVHPAKTLVVDITDANKQMGKVTNVYPERYPKRAEFFKGFPGPREVDRFLNDLDVVFMIESPYTYGIIKVARERGIKTVLQYNFEFLDYFIRPDWPMPDLLLAPSPWRMEEVREKFGDKAEVTYLQVPVNRELLPFRERDKLTKFLHVAGHKTHKDRNGTDVVIEAIKQIDDPQIYFTIYSQHPIPEIDKPNVKVLTTDVLNYWELYGDNDVLLLPRKYGGLSLQLAEAMSKGMVPLMTDMHPQNQFLGSHHLLPVSSIKTFFTRMNIDCYEPSVQGLVDKIKHLAYLDEAETKKLSQYSDVLAKQLDWNVLLPEYLKTFTALCSKP